MRTRMLLLMLLCLFTINSGAWAAGDDHQTIALWHMDVMNWFNSTDQGVYDDDVNNFTCRDRQLNYGNSASNPPIETRPVLVAPGYNGTGKAIQFDGIANEATATKNWDNYDSVVVDLRFNAARATGSQVLAEATDAWSVALNNADVTFTVWTSGSSRTYTVTNAVALNTWQHVIASCNAAGHVSLQVDALTAVQGDGLPLVIASKTLHLGNKAGGAKFFQGLIDEVKISVPSLGSSLGNFNAPFTDSGSTLVLSHFDAYNATWGIADDDSAKPGRDADWKLYSSDSPKILINHEPVPGSDGVWLADPSVAGSGDYLDPAIGYPADNSAFGKCIYFDGYSGSAQMAWSKLPIDGQNVQIEFWLRIPDEWTAGAAGDDNRSLAILDRWNQIALNILDWSKVTPNSNGVCFEMLMWNTGGGVPDQKIYFKWVPGFDYKKWHHYAFRSLGKDIQAYVDGVLLFHYQMANGIQQYTSTYNNYLGLRSWSNLSPFWGYLDDFRVTRVIPVCGDLGYNAMDFNKDCVVDFKDLVVVLQDWVKSDNPLPATNGTENYPAVTAAGWADRGNYNIPRATVVPTIDGVFHSTEWADARPIEMVPPALTTAPNIGNVIIHPEWSPPCFAPTNNADFSLIWYAKWDTDYLYLAGVIYDDIVSTDPSLDAPQICFNFLNDSGHTYLDQAFVWDFRSDNTWTTHTAFTPSTDTMFRRVNNPTGLAGYVIEAKLKWSDLSLGTMYTPAISDKHGFGFACQDHDAGNLREHFLYDMNVSNTVQNMGIPSNWNTITLVNTMPCYEKDGIYKGDLNLSCKVDMGDFANFAQQWLNCMDASGVKCKM